jgi:predicted GIY-YIG superfamily endonuclease
MLKPYEKNIKWNKKKCQEEALKYNNKKDLIVNNKTVYHIIIKNNWLDFLLHMKSTYKPKNFWTKEKCQEEALKYNNKNEFKKNNNVAYNKSLKYNWLEEITIHMIDKYKSDSFWTKEKCQEEALKYNSRTEFYKKSPNFYKKSLEKNWIDDICSHMKKYGNRFKRCIYSYEFDDNYCYIGLTSNLIRRNNQHFGKEKNTKSSVFEHINKTNLIPKLIQLTDYISLEDAIKKEKYYLNKYKKEKWIILNKIKTGGIGGNILKWTKEKCQEEALKYNKRSQFAINSPCAYSSSLKHDWLNEVCNHMK